MGATYTRQSSAGITDGAVIEASDLNDEFDQLLASFVAASGHTHDGTAAEGGPVTKLLGNTLTFGAATAGTDITVTFDGETSDGVLYWMEDEDHFKFADDIVVDSSKKLYFYDEGGEYISGDGTDLNLVSGADINIPANIGLTFGDDGEKIEGDGTDLTISASALANIDAGTDIVLDADGGDIFFKDGGTTFGSATNTSGNLIIKSGTTTAATFSGANVTLAGTVGSGAITSTGIVTGSAFTAGSAVLAEAELELLDGLTAGTAIASKVVTTDSSIDTTGQRNLTISGELDAATLDISGNADIDGTTNLDAVDIDGAVQIDATFTSGVDGQGYDTKFFGDTASAYMLGYFSRRFSSSWSSWY